MKKNTRRKFISNSIKAGVGLPLIGNQFFSCKSEGGTPDKKLNILILGGTSFLGPHQVAYALGRGHSVTTFTRGKTQPTVHQELFKNVEALVGDRKDNLKALENRNWDVVIDNSGRNVEWTKATAELLKDNVGLYVYISSTGVYYPYLGNDIKEDTKVLLEEPKVLENEEERMEYWYGVMKANSEKTAQTVFGEDRTIVIRPTYMVGPADKLDRFIHWPVRLSKGGEILVPGKAEDPVQYIDVRDVAEWTIRLIEGKKVGTYNAVGPAAAQNMYDFIAEAKTAFDVESTLVKIDDYDFLKKNEVYYIVPWIMPEGNNIGSALVSNAKAKANGLTFRDLKRTMKDTYDWWYSDALTDERRAKFEKKEGSILMKEKEILDAWKVVEGF